MTEIELWAFRLFSFIIGGLGVDYLLNVRTGSLFRKKDDCETMHGKLYKENREDHDKINDKQDELLRCVSAVEGELKRINGKSGNT